MSRQRYHLGLISIRNLIGVDSGLVAVVVRAINITLVDFRVHEGVRSAERQRYLVNRGKSKTMNSRHLIGEAVDLHPIPLSWDPSDSSWDAVASAMHQASRELSVPVENGYELWGWDRPHWQRKK